MGSAYRLRSMWYCWADCSTNSSTSANGWLDTMYIACRGRLEATGVETDGESDVAVARASAAATSEAGGGGRDAHPGRQASISTKRTRQSLPPLYESERWSGLAGSKFKSAGVAVAHGIVPPPTRPNLGQGHAAPKPTRTDATPAG